MMDVTRNVGNKYIDGAVYMDLKHWKRTVSNISISIFHHLAFVLVSYYGGSILGIRKFLTYRNSSEIQNILKNKTKERQIGRCC